MEKLHPKYNPEATMEAWNSARFPRDRPPVLSAFQPTGVVGDKLIFERNPYYWKVDAEGQQLPYFDTVVMKYQTNGSDIALGLASDELWGKFEHALDLDAGALSNDENVTVDSGSAGGETPMFRPFAKAFPTPTSEMEIERSILQREDGESSTWGEVDNIIAGILDKNGYKHRYFLINDGFAISTFDQYHCDTGENLGRGVSFDKIAAGARDVIEFVEGLSNHYEKLKPLVDGVLEHVEMADAVPDVATGAVFMLRAFIPGLIMRVLPVGCYRSLIFAITKGDVRVEDREMKYHTAKRLMRLGSRNLDDQTRNVEYGEQHKTTVLIYQYHRSDAKAVLIESDDDRSIEAACHLLGAGLPELLVAQSHDCRTVDEER